MATIDNDKDSTNDVGKSIVGKPEKNPLLLINYLISNLAGKTLKEITSHEKWPRRVRDNSSPSAVLILGNPKYFGKPYVKPFYQSIVSFLKKLGCTVKVVSSSPGTEIPSADLWIGHSRGTEFLNSAPTGTKTIGLGYSDGLYHPKDNAAVLISKPPPGWSPNKYHFTFTNEMKDAIKEATSALNVDRKSA